jgi:hypothetical protein
MRGRYRFLIHLRERIPSLHSRDWLLLPPQPGTQVLDYLRYTGHDSDPVLAVFNFGLKPAEARVRLPPRFAGLTASGALRDLISGKTFAADGTSVSLPMGPESARILVNG